MPVPKPHPLHPFNDADSRAMLHEMAQDMSVTLFKRYNTKEATTILDIPEAELTALRERGEIAYLLVGDQSVAFFGYQLLMYLLQCIVPLGVSSEQNEEEPKGLQPHKPAVSPDAELLSVVDTMTLLGIGRTKLYDLIKTNELLTVKIGRRTLIRRSSIKRLITA